MNPPGSVTFWITELKCGDELAAQQALWDRYFRRLVGLARSKLGDVPRRAMDEEDVAIRSMTSFFEAMTSGRFPQLRDRSGLWPLLAAITPSKAPNRRRWHSTVKRGKGQVRGESAFAECEQQGIDEVVAADPTPELVVEAAEQCQRLLDALNDDQLRAVAQMKLAGFSSREISRRLNVVVRTVERKLNRFRKEWIELCDL